MTLPASDWIAFHADRTPDKLACIDQLTGRQFTYQQFHQRIGRLAAFFRDAWGIQAGDRVAILAKNCTEYFEFQFAMMRLGAMMLPLNWRLAEPEQVFILNDAEVTGLVYDADFAERIPSLLAQTTIQYHLQIDLGQQQAGNFEAAITSTSACIPQIPASMTHDTPVIIMYTAGTTGNPKGVLITHGMMFWNAVNITVPTSLDQESVNYTVLPLFHIGGLNLYANPAFHLGGCNIIAREFDAATVLQTLSDPALGVTHFFGVPSVYLFMSQHPDFDSADLSRIQSWGCGGAPMPVTVLETYAKRGIIIQLGFGMTETSPTVFLIAKRHVMNKPTSVGRPLLHTRVRIVNDDFQDMPIGEVGEVIVGGPNVTPGYWKRPEANDKSFYTDENGLRWIRSGDAGMMDEEGCIYIVDRYKDMYISGGENVYPAEVEQVIFQIAEVADVGVIGVPDEKWGESGLAVVVVKPASQLEESAILSHCKTALAKYKVPKGVVFTDVLPRNAAGKILKRTLREQFAPKL